MGFSAYMVIEPIRNMSLHGDCVNTLGVPKSIFYLVPPSAALRTEPISSKVQEAAMWLHAASLDNVWYDWQHVNGAVK